MSGFSSAQHSDVKALRRLVGRRSARLGAGLCVVEGSKVIAEAVRGGAVVTHLFVAGDYEDSLTVELSLLSSVVVHRLVDGVLNGILDTVTAQPVVALVATPVLSGVEQLELGTADCFVVVGVDVRDPGNAGTMIRSAELSGASAVMFLGTSVDVASPKVVRSSAGALFHVSVVQSDDVAGSFEWLRSSGVRLLGAAVHGEAVGYSDAGVLTGRVAVVMGNEANGLDGLTRALIDGWVTIPMLGNTESLNVAMATTVLCFEAARQRQ